MLSSLFWIVSTSVAPSKLLLCQELKKEVEFHNKTALSVENTGTYLKYFGCKRDTVYVKNLLVGVKIRWKKTHSKK